MSGGSVNPNRIADLPTLAGAVDGTVPFQTYQVLSGEYRSLLARTGAQFFCWCKCKVPVRVLKKKVLRMGSAKYMLTDSDTGPDTSPLFFIKARTYLAAL